MKLVKKKSKINGKGIFTREEIKKGSKFYIIPVKKISSTPKPRNARIGNNKFVNDPLVLNWVNHSCSPNVKIVIKTKKPYLKAIKKIVRGEEITVDYNKTEKGNYLIKCNCKSKLCRGTFSILQ